MTSLKDDERGLAFAQVAGLIIAPIVALVIAGATISAVRTGSGLTDAVSRTAQTQIMLDDFKNDIAAGATLTANSATNITVTIDPEALPAGITLDASAYGAHCTTVTYDLAEDAGLRTLTQTRDVHEADCVSPITTTTVNKITGFTAPTTFEIRNVAGRELSADGGALTGASDTKPAGVADGAWESLLPATVTLDGVVQDMFTDRQVSVTGFVPLG